MSEISDYARGARELAVRTALPSEHATIQAKRRFTLSLVNLPATPLIKGK
ncbi:hypothetical protein NBRC116494_17940 [Aurantivibrio plasticivorans]